MISTNHNFRLSPVIKMDMRANRASQIASFLFRLRNTRRIPSLMSIKLGFPSRCASESLSSDRIGQSGFEFMGIRGLGFKWLLGSFNMYFLYAFFMRGPCIQFLVLNCGLGLVWIWEWNDHLIGVLILLEYFCNELWVRLESYFKYCNLFWFRYFVFNLFGCLWVHINFNYTDMSNL